MTLVPLHGKAGLGMDAPVHRRSSLELDRRPRAFRYGPGSHTSSPRCAQFGSASPIGPERPRLRLGFHPWLTLSGYAIADAFATVWLEYRAFRSESNRRCTIDAEAGCQGRINTPAGCRTRERAVARCPSRGLGQARAYLLYCRPRLAFLLLRTGVACRRRAQSARRPRRTASPSLLRARLSKSAAGTAPCADPRNA